MSWFDSLRALPSDSKGKWSYLPSIGLGTEQFPLFSQVVIETGAGILGGGAAGGHQSIQGISDLPAEAQLKCPSFHTFGAREIAPDGTALQWPFEMRSEIGALSPGRRRKFSGLGAWLLMVMEPQVNRRLLGILFSLQVALNKPLRAEQPLPGVPES